MGNDKIEDWATLKSQPKMWAAKRRGELRRNKKKLRKLKAEHRKYLAIRSE